MVEIIQALSYQKSNWRLLKFDVLKKRKNVSVNSLPIKSMPAVVPAILIYHSRDN